MAEQRAERRNQRLRALLDGMDEGFILLDRDFCVLEINAETLRHGGKTREQVLGRNHFEVWPNLDGTEFAALYRRAMTERVKVSLEGPYKFADGSSGWLDMRAVPTDDGIAIFYRDTTERRAQQRALELSEERQRLALEGSRMIAWDYDPVTRWTECAAGAEALLGYSRIHIDDFVASLHPDDRSLVNDAFSAALSGGVYEVKYRLRPRGEDGYLWFDARARVRRDAAGKPKRLVGVMIDVTDREQARAEAAASARDVAMLADNIDQLVWTARPDGEIVWFNRRWYEYTGDQPQGRSDPIERCHPNDRERTVASYRAAIAAGEPWEATFPLRGRDGVYRWFLTRAQPIRDADGAIRRWFGTNTDIDAVKRLEAELLALNTGLGERVREAVAERNRVFELSDDLFATAAFDGRLRSLNPAWQRLLGFNDAELMSRPFIDFVHVDDRERVLAAIRSLRDGEPVHGVEHRISAADGREIWLSWTAVAEAGLFYVVGRDVSRDRQREEQIAQMQKLETIGQLSGGIAHDFNNLLTPIIASFDLLQRRYASDAGSQRLLGAGLHAAERAKVLVQRLLAFARRQHLEARAIDIAALLAGIRDLVDSSVGPGITVSIDVDPALPLAHVDPGQLELALLNLIVNARDAMPDGGRLAIRAAPATGSEAGSDLVPDGRYVGIAVADTGTGMSAATLSRAVEPFFTTKPIGKGTGLGLSMVHGLAVQSGGGLRLDSPAGQGVIATLYLPVASQTATQVAGPAAISAATVRANILLVDDEPLVRAAAATMLADLGHHVVEAPDGPTALERLAGDATTDLLITDYLMPGQNGGELIRAARLLRPGLPALVISGFSEADAALAGLSDVRRLSKPFRQDALAAQIAALLGPGHVPTADHGAADSTE